VGEKYDIGCTEAFVNFRSPSTEADEITLAALMDFPDSSSYKHHLSFPFWWAENSVSRRSSGWCLRLFPIANTLAETADTPPLPWPARIYTWELQVVSGVV